MIEGGEKRKRERERERERRKEGRKEGKRKRKKERERKEKTSELGLTQDLGSIVIHFERRSPYTDRQCVVLSSGNRSLVRHNLHHLQYLTVNKKKQMGHHTMVKKLSML
jgi:hypothetical protein